jgi:glycosyltransferase involved in cell wall biosynthesis
MKQKLKSAYLLFALINSLIFLIDAKLVVITCSYNNKDYYQENLRSLFMQSETDWIGYYIDDCSTDGTYELAYEFAKEHNMLDHMIFIKNQQNFGSLYNQYHIITQLDDRDIVVILDGDDQFYDDTVLCFIKQTYLDEKVWLTYGSYVPLNEPYPVFCKDVTKCKTISNQYFFRRYPWFFSHLRTFYAGLFKKIKKEDLLYKGEFFNFCQDHAVMFPMLEMANGKNKHYKYIAKKLYIYNNVNPICEHKRKDFANWMGRFIRNKVPYNPIDNLF